MRTEYYFSLYQNPHIRLRWFLPMIKKAVELGVGARVATMEPLPLNGIDYTLLFSAEASTDERGRIYLYLDWEDEEETYTQKIRILKEESHLIPGSYVYFFLCPHGYKSKKLFYIANEWRSRRAFRHRYGKQNRSHLQRETDNFSQDEPYKPYGKEYYRGKLTPYGRRCLKYERNQESGLVRIFRLVDKIQNNLKK